MLSEAEFTDYCNRLAFPAAGLRYLDHARISGPSRKVGGGGGNVTALFPSAKMGRVITVESHRVELTFAYLMERDATVLEFHDQPPPVQLRFLSQAGREIAVNHTPDFLVIRKDSAGWVECKPLEKLEQLAQSSPKRYSRDSTGEWHCPPGEQVAAEHGFFYRVWFPTEREQVLARNFRFLGDFFVTDYPDVPGCARDRIVSLVRREAGLTLAELGSRTRADSLDDIFRLIATGEIYVDLEALPLAQPDRVRVFVNRATAQAYGLLGSGLGMVAGTSRQQLANAPCARAQTESMAISQAESVKDATLRLKPAGQEVLRAASAADLEVANRRFAVLQDTDRASEESRRTLRRWRQLYRSAEVRFGSGYIGLIPRVSASGNRTPRFSQETLELAASVIREQYAAGSGRPGVAAYREFTFACEVHCCVRPSYQWFVKEIEKWRSKQAVETSALGNTAWRESVTASDVHGDWPWDTAHIDHYLCDVELVCSETGLALGKPWLTMMFDPCCRRALAIWLAFERPSYRSCMMAVRDCVRRHQRLPNCILFDGGGEFGSEYFESLAATYAVTLKRRPTKMPHFGSVIERFLGSLKTMFFANLSGSTVMPPETNPSEATVLAKGAAVWTLERLNDLLEEFVFKVYDNRLHPSLGMSPAEEFIKRTALGGTRPTRTIAYNEEFVIQTLPLTPRGGATIQRGSGVKINRIYYWCEAMRESAWHGQVVPVRYDPFNISVAYAFLNRRWTRCVSKYAQQLCGHSESELKTASARILKRGVEIDGRREADSREIAEFFRDLRGEEGLRLENLQRLAERRLRNQVSENLELHDAVGEPIIQPLLPSTKIRH